MIKFESVQTEKKFIEELIHDGFYDKLVIIGFPYDQGARGSAGVKIGHDLGPDSFRRFVKEIGVIQNPEFGIDISKGLPQISDYGNIQIEGKPQHHELLEKLASKVSLCVQRQKVPFVIGGTRDLSVAVSNTVCTQKGKSSLLILFRRFLDIEDSPLQHDSKSSLTTIIGIAESQKVIVIVPKEDSLTNLPPNVQIVSLENNESQIMFNLHNLVKLFYLQHPDFSTRAGYILADIIEKANSNESIDQIYISISLESIQGVTGVTQKCHNGLSTEEAIDICLVAGRYSKKLVAVDLTDYNPLFEDWSTGRLAAEMFYYFTLGYSASLQQ